MVVQGSHGIGDRALFGKLFAWIHREAYNEGYLDGMEDERLVGGIIDGQYLTPEAEYFKLGFETARKLAGNDYQRGVTDGLKAKLRNFIQDCTGSEMLADMPEVKPR